MRKIVADRSPIISFSRAKKLHLIQGVYGKIIIPPEVYNEIVVKGKGRPGAEEIRKTNWVNVQKPKNQDEVEKLKENFDSGESEAIVLAEELKAILLVDEMYPQPMQCAPQSFKGSFRIAIKSAAPHPPEAPAASLQHPLAGHIVFVTLGSMPGITIALDRKTALHPLDH